MVTIRVPGEQAGSTAGGISWHRPGQTRFGVTVTPREAVRVGVTRGAASKVQISAQPDDIVELVMVDGAKLYMRADETVERLPSAASRSFQATDEVELEASLPLGPSERGLIGGWVIKGLQILGVDLPKTTAIGVAKAFEDRVLTKGSAEAPSIGLHRWLPDKTLVPVEGELEPAKEGQPWLLFLHGTASSTLGGFGQLTVNEKLWRSLHMAYPERVLAFDHRTLTEGPLANTRQLMEALPKGAELHVVSHSRGGLIGELLARAQLQVEDVVKDNEQSSKARHKSNSAFDDLDHALFQDEIRREQAADLTQLGELFAKKAPELVRFVRVACPARGTTLAAAKLDRWLNLMLNVFGFAIQGLGAPITGEIYDGLQAFLLAVIKERTDPRTIPGLEAMIPGSPTMKLLNRADVRSAADLSIIEGDCEPSGVLQRLKIWFADVYYGEDHDLIVNTSSMSGGVPRFDARVFLDRGSNVDHFHYFGNARTAQLMLDGLSRPDGQMVGYSKLEAREPIELHPNSRGESDSRPIVYVLPGITGSMLSVGDRSIWIDILRLMAGGLRHLGIDQPNVTATQPIARYYGELCEHLAQGHEVRPWAYDWRRPILDLGRLFAAQLGRDLAETRRPVRIVAHSMGGLVARAAFLDGDVWRRFKERDGCRLIQLGTPNGGSYSIPMMLMGRNGLLSALGVADLTMSRADQLKIVSAWPGAIQMLPQSGDIDWYQTAVWQRFGRADDRDIAFEGPSATDLLAAAAFRTAFAQAPLDPERMYYIAGQGPTVDGVVVDPDQKPGERIRFTRTNEGDGQVLWRTGIPSGIQVWYADAAHGDLARHRPAFEAIRELLEHGRTTRLPTQPSATRAVAVLPSIAREEALIQPDADDVVAAALGARRGERRAAPLPRIRLRVVHGNLALARYPVMVGHYPGDTIAGPESALDRALDGSLQARRRMGLYPGPIGTNNVVLDMAKRPRGAVLVGLGDPGNLAMGSLMRTLRQGLLAYAAAEMDRRRSAGDTTTAGASLSTILVGAGEGGLGRAACVLALLRAAARAQSVLATPDDAAKTLPLGQQVAFDEIEILELYEYRALEIWHVIRTALGERAELADHFQLYPEVVRQGGGRRRLFGGQRSDWWQPVQVSMEELGPTKEKSLRYTIAGGMARAESQLVGANLDIVRTLLQRTIDGTQTYGGTASPSRALFELLWPVRFKEFSEDDRNLRLILDPASAQFPWELMDDRRPWTSDGSLPDSLSRKPAAVRSGVVRQLVQTRFREYVTMPRGSRKALVIGDPRGRPMEGFVELPGARREAEAVADALAQTHHVTRLIGDEVLPEHVTMQLFAEAWEIIHIAAHGVVDHEIKHADGTVTKATGIVIGGNVILGPSALAQLSVSPELFFLNCCHLGRIDADAEQSASLAAARAQRPELAASVAVELIKNGVRGIVAAGWAVDDDAAAIFATTFYKQMLKGADFGDATQVARSHAYDCRPGGTTWGAYQCYGEPDMQLPAIRRQVETASPDEVFAAPSELVVLAEQITEDLNVGLERDADALTRRLEKLEQAAECRPEWASNAELHVAFGEAFGELGDFEKAINHYQAATKGTDTKFKVRAIEQLANVGARWACLQHRAGKLCEPEAVRQITDTRERVNNLVKVLGDTVERSNLLGSSWKRLAQVQAKSCTQALKQMEKAYQAALSAAKPSEKTYPAQMVATAQILLSLHDSKLQPKAQVIADLGQIIDAPLVDETNFWALCAQADARLLMAINNGKLGVQEEQAILGCYMAAWRHVGSPLKLRSVLEQLDFLQDILASTPPGRTGLDQLAAAIGRIRVQLDLAPTQ